MEFLDGVSGLLLHEIIVVMINSNSHFTGKVRNSGARMARRGLDKIGWGGWRWETASCWDIPTSILCV
jgi:hypothetical protein